MILRRGGFRRLLLSWQSGRGRVVSHHEGVVPATSRLPLRLGVALLVLPFLSPGTVALAGDGAGLPPRRAVDPELEEAVDALRRRGLEEAERMRPDLEATLPVLQAQTDRMIRQAAGLPAEAPPAPAGESGEQASFVYFTSRRCSQCTAELDLAVKAFMDAHPELQVGVIYLGDPFAEAEAAADVYLSFIGDVVDRWRDRLADPAFMAALEQVGSVKDRSGRVQVRFSTTEAERLGIDRVPAFLFMAGEREVVAYGRPGDVAETFETILEEVRREG